MKAAVEDFGNSLKKGDAGLLYYTGHGVLIGGINYLIPIGAGINKESDVKYAALMQGKTLDLDLWLIKKLNSK